MSSTIDEAGSVRHALDADKLAAFLRANVASFDGDLAVQQFSHGQSNPTYLLRCGTSYQCVLRKQPHGKLLKSAHDVAREYHVMSALQDTNVPVPRMLCYCEDDLVVGTPFFVMEFVAGRVFKEPTLAELKPIERYAIYAAMCDVLASIHRVDWRRYPGLAELGGVVGGGANYVERQLSRWRQQYESGLEVLARSNVESSEHVAALVAWLGEHATSSEVLAEEAAGGRPACLVVRRRRRSKPRAVDGH